MKKQKKEDTPDGEGGAGAGLYPPEIRVISNIIQHSREPFQQELSFQELFHPFS